MKRTRTSSKAKWESLYGYCRAMRVGDQVFVSGTVSVNDDGSTYAPGDGFAQASRCYATIDAALRELGVGREHVVRARMFVTDIGRCDEFGRAHKAYFADESPCLTMVEVSRLISTDMLIEIEIDAIA